MAVVFGDPLGSADVQSDDAAGRCRGASRGITQEGVIRLLAGDACAQQGDDASYDTGQECTGHDCDSDHRFSSPLEAVHIRPAIHVIRAIP
jgi:hypothetical protein